MDIKGSIYYNEIIIDNTLMSKEYTRLKLEGETRLRLNLNKYYDADDENGFKS